MKALKFLFVALALLMVAPTFTSCKDDEEEELMNDIVGTWVCREVDPDNGSRWEIKLSLLANGDFIVIDEGEYAYGRYTSYGTELIFTFDDGFKGFGTISGNTLIFEGEDGDIFRFKKK